MDFQRLKLSQSARMVINTCLGIKAGDRALLVADFDTEVPVVEALLVECNSTGAETTVVFMPPRKRPGEEPPETVARAIEGANVVFSVATTPITHCTCIQNGLKEKRIRFLSLPDVGVDLMTKGAALADYNEVYRISKKIVDELTAATTIQVLSEGGTNLTAKLTGMRRKVGASFAREPGTMSTFPGGEAFAGPAEGSANGTVVIDTSIHMIGKLNQPIIYEVKNGKVVAIKGGIEAEQLKRIIEGVPNADNIAETSIGTNPLARITGNVSEDKKGLGRVHIAIGDNIFTGGTTKCSLHIDGVILRPTVILDGKTIIANGELKI